MAQYSAPRRSGLGPGFWPVTIALTVVNLIVTYVIIIFPFDSFVKVMGEPGGDVDLLFRFMSVIGNAIFVYVAGYLVYFSIVWRRRAGESPDTIGIQIHDNNTLEFWWTAIPAIVVVILAIFSIKIWVDLQRSEGGGVTMEAIGHQFNYEFRYANLKQSVYNDMHLPVNTPITVDVTAADVIHSFWLPEMRLKGDMVPGLIQTLRFTPKTVGKYRIICTEFCGTNHANMAANLYVDSRPDFDKWIAGQAKAQAGSAQPVAFDKGNATAGATLFTQKCASCHNVNGTWDQKIVGPGLGHIMSDSAHPNLVTGEKPNAKDIAYILEHGYDGPDKSTAGAPGPTLGIMPNREANGLTNTMIADLSTYLVAHSSK